MAWRIEFSPVAREDLRTIFRFLFGVHHDDFGNPLEEAEEKASARIPAIEVAAQRIAAALHIGTVHLIDNLSVRHVNIDRAIYWFTLDEAAETVRVEGIFHGGQDHLGRMLARLTAEGDAT